MKILLIDDSADARVVAVARLAHEGHEILCAAGGAEGLEMARREHPDLVLLDVDMPDLNGFDVCQQLKDDRTTCSIPVIFLSGAGDANDKARGLDLGAVDYVTKPFDAFELRARVRSALRTKQLQDHLARSSQIDKLTNLPNRVLLLERLQQAILRRERCPEEHYAVLFLDFDRFKVINDSLGHEAGDQLLVQIADRLRGQVRATDSVTRLPESRTAMRLGGDEFVVLLEGMVGGRASAMAVAQRLLDTLAEPYQVGESRIVSTASIGVVTDEGGYLRAEDVLRDADTAMYEAKAAGRGQAVLFDVTMRERVRRRLSLENELRLAIEAGQLVLHYQPIICLDSGRLVGVEALVRWCHPERGMVLPGEFIPVAEDCGLIIPLGDWVLGEACRQLGVWQRTLGADRIPSVNVNLSARQFVIADFAERVARAAGDGGIEPSSVHLEITESAVMQDVAAATRLLHDLKSQGFKVALDDFGTGHSSLACLHEFPLDVVKIDRLFVKNMSRGRHYTALVHAIVALARNLNLEVVAEGVETADLAPPLQYLGCQYAQGYFFGRPVPAEQVVEYRPPATLADTVLAAPFFD
jgi:diguanylate cyclase (GGDEF)-like protein